VLAQGDEVFGQAVFWSVILGSILAPALAGIGMLVSLWCSSNRTSMFISLGLYLFLFLPTQLPGKAQTGAAGALLQQVNPMAATTHFLAKILVNNRTFAEMRPWFWAPVILSVVVVVLLFLFAGGLSLEGTRLSLLRMKRGRGVGLFVIAYILLSLGASPMIAQEATSEQSSLQIDIDLDYQMVRAGEPIFYNTVVTNIGKDASPPLTVAMNIINLDALGEVVDPEDWSPQRTQYIESLAAGASASLAWRVNAILDGDYMVYMVAIPKPDGEEATSQPVASSGIHLTVAPFTRLNPGGVLPYAIGGPIIVAAIIYFVSRFRRREIDAGGS
jgi:hypothetical protein